jgi:hypothetical protein
MTYVPTYGVGASDCYDESNPDWSCDATPSTITTPALQPIVQAPSSGGDVGSCAGVLVNGVQTVYNQFYGSCVTPCPKDSFGRTQHYDPNNGYCVPDQGMSTMAMVGIGVGVVAGYMLLFGKKRRQRR